MDAPRGKTARGKASLWRGKYKSPAEYWLANYPKEYFSFDKYELAVDPDETLDDFEEYDAQTQHKEYIKCAMSFPYFATKYLKILHIKNGLVPFVLFDYQRRVIQEYEDHRFNIIRKFRQGGLTTVTELWCLWRCLFKLDQQILFLSKTDREAIAAGMILNRAVDNLPSWMRPKKDEGKWNDHEKQFKDTGSNMFFYTPEAARGRTATFLILDEAAFVDNMDRHWKAMYPTLSQGGSCIAISTVNGIGNWYQETWEGAEKNENGFNPINLHYTEHPEYHDDKWVRETKAQLGEKGWLQEVLGEFLGSGETYISSKVIGELRDRTKDNYPRRKLFAKWANPSRDKDEMDSPGAMWVWKEPKEGHDYILGVDCAEGVGREGDNSCIQVIDTTTLEQVAEFYSNSIPPYLFAQVISEVGIYYNNGMVVVENMGAGGAVLSNLQHELFYENLYYDQNGRAANKPGIKTTVSNRPVVLECLQHRLLNGTLRINSRRFVTELTTFMYNPQTQKVAALKGKGHDDAIMALCMAIYVRDSVLREVPVGVDTPPATNTQNAVLEEIKRELLEGAPINLLESNISEKWSEDDDMLTGVVLNFRRKHDRLLKEFGW